MERRLSAILAADVVGYSRLMEADEAGTFDRLRTHRKELFEPEIAKHHGRIFKLMGDGLLAEFGSIVDAVECAVVLQRAMAKRNKDIPDGQRIDVRMGINLGDVIVEGEDRYGEGINIAARLQSLADAGGIILSGTAFDQLKKRVDVGFESLGEQQVKNIAEPVRVYRILLDGQAPPHASTRVRNRRPQKATTGALAMVLIALSGGAAWYWSGERQPIQPDQGIPVIAVLPFQDLTGDNTTNELGKGIADTFMSDLATFPDYEVVSAATSFSLANKPLSEIVKATGATFVVEGSFRRTADKLKVTMQLIRGSTDRHLMIAEIEEPLTDPVRLQAAVASRLRDELGGMTGVLRKESNNIALAKAPADLHEYDYYILGHIKHFRRDGVGARDIWAKGLERFPDSVLLRCKLVFYYLVFTSDRASVKRLVNEARTLKKKSRLDEWYLHWASARVAVTWPQSVAEAEAAVAIAPYDTVSRMDLSEIMSRAGRNDEAIAWATYAMTHDPSPLPWYPNSLIQVYRSGGKYTELVDLAERETQNHPSSKIWYEVLWRAYSETGQTEKAVEALKVADNLPDPPRD
jgi:class 3 adenylate cyclase/TolB-like protein